MRCSRLRELVIPAQAKLGRGTQGFEGAELAALRACSRS